MAQGNNITCHTWWHHEAEELDLLLAVEIQHFPEEKGTRDGFGCLLDPDYPEEFIFIRIASARVQMSDNTFITLTYIPEFTQEEENDLLEKVVEEYEGEEEPEYEYSGYEYQQF